MRVGVGESARERERARHGGRRENMVREGDREGDRHGQGFADWGSGAPRLLRCGKQQQHHHHPKLKKVIRKPDVGMSPKPT